MIVVLFSVTPSDGADAAEVRETSARMHEIVEAMPGFISYKDYAADDGEGIAVVRFESDEALDEWRNHPEHRAAQRKGRDSFYDRYWVQVCRTIREYQFTREEGHSALPAEAFRMPMQP
jgi:heme-degrading monooxygenase HmoA